MGRHILLLVLLHEDLGYRHGFLLLFLLVCTVFATLALALLLSAHRVLVDLGVVLEEETALGVGHLREVILDVGAEAAVAGKLLGTLGFARGCGGGVDCSQGSLVIAIEGSRCGC